MGLLGGIGQVYMFFLLVLLILGFGLGTWAIIKSIFLESDTIGGRKKGPVKKKISETLNQ